MTIPEDSFLLVLQTEFQKRLLRIVMEWYSVLTPHMVLTRTGGLNL